MIDFGATLGRTGSTVLCAAGDSAPPETPAPGARTALLQVLAVALWGISACSPADSVRNQVREPATKVTTLDERTPGDLALSEIAEVMALNSRATQLQREALEKRLPGSIVQWKVIVYDVKQDGDHYRILSQPVSITDPGAVPLLRVMAVVHPASSADHQRIAALKTGDPVTIKGVAEEVTMRALVTLQPARLTNDRKTP